MRECDGISIVRLRVSNRTHVEGQRVSSVWQVMLQNKLGAPGAPKVTASMVAPTLLGQRCWVRWPYLQEAIVQGVSDRTEKVSTGSFTDSAGNICWQFYLL